MKGLIKLAIFAFIVWRAMASKWPHTEIHMESIFVGLVVPILILAGFKWLNSGPKPAYKPAPIHGLRKWADPDEERRDGKL